MLVAPLGDSAVVITMDDGIGPAVLSRVRTVAAGIERHRLAGVVDVVPAFGVVAVYFDPALAESWEERRARIEAVVAKVEPPGGDLASRVVEIPVQYGGEAGPDLATVAERSRLSPDEVIARHAAGGYKVHAIGFVPGFPYLGGLPAELHTPRLTTPRPAVPAGSVGIAGAQTGVYPLPTPGGWNLIGRTPLSLFDVERAEPSLLRMGDQVKFRAITASEFAGLAKRDRAARSVNRPPAAGITLRVLRAGLFTTVQDLGRTGHRARGVPLSGAADPFALRLANLLVGNPEGAAGLEFTLVGPELKFERDTFVAITGAHGAALPGCRPIAIRRGATLRIGPLTGGCRGYLAVAGGIDVPAVLGSRSTYARAGLGGLAGRALRDGDELAVPETQRSVSEHWRIDERILPAYSPAPAVRVVPAAQTAEFGADWAKAEFTVSAQSDRMGARLRGAALPRHAGRELASSPVTPGTVQVPPDGQPIVLLADAQTIGGYPQIATVISVDLPLVAQLRPGDRVRFHMVAPAEAHRLTAAREHGLSLLREGLKEKWT